MRQPSIGGRACEAEGLISAGPLQGR